MPQVSVVTSTFNRRALVAQSLRSALGQRGVDLEVVVVDNASTDGTAELLSGWRDPRIQVVRHRQSLGSVGGRNAGLRAASGKWLAILDDDDLWAPDKLRTQLAAATAAGRDWAYTGAVHIDGTGRVLGGRPPPPPGVVMGELPIRYVLPGGISNVVWRREALDGGGLLDPRLPFPADWDLALRLSRHGPPAAVARPFVAYRQHGHNLSRRAAEFERELHLLADKHADLAAGRRLDWGAQHRFVASEALRAGSRRDAAAAYARAVVAGDRGSLPRAAGVLAPRRLQRWLVRTTLSDRAWLEEAEAWLVEAEAGQAEAEAGRAEAEAGRAEAEAGQAEAEAGRAEAEAGRAEGQTRLQRFDRTDVRLR
jgi:glycosyltransferase involved in cell wall biosynthesis